MTKRSVDQVPGDLRPGLRFPTPDDPAPPARRMVGISLWATALALAGLAVGARALVAMMFQSRLPGWFPPTVIATGLLGVVLTGSAFAAVHGRRLPVLMLTGATGALLATLILTLVAV